MRLLGASTVEDLRPEMVSGNKYSFVEILRTTVMNLGTASGLASVYSS